MNQKDKFKVPVVPNTINKSIRFPVDLVASVEKVIVGKDSNFSTFVIAAVRYALDHMDNNDKEQ